MGLPKATSSVWEPRSKVVLQPFACVLVNHRDRQRDRNALTSLCKMYKHGEFNLCYTFLSCPLLPHRGPLKFNETFLFSSSIIYFCCNHYLFCISLRKSIPFKQEFMEDVSSVVKKYWFTNLFFLFRNSCVSFYI